MFTDIWDSTTNSESLYLFAWKVKVSIRVFDEKCTNDMYSVCDFTQAIFGLQSCYPQHFRYETVVQLPLIKLSWKNVTDFQGYNNLSRSLVR